MTHWRGGLGLISSLGKVRLLWSLALGTSGFVAACSSEPLADPSEDVGSLGVNLEVAPGVTLDAVSYSITGNGFSKTGTIDTGGSPTINGRIGGIPAGAGYTITLTA